jgi:hypothetical protein
MRELDAALQDAKGDFDKIGAAEVVVGIPSFNNAATIGPVVEAVQQALAKFFADHPSVIINSDAGSTDGTQDRIQEIAGASDGLIRVAHPLFPVHKLTAPYHGLPGRGSAYRTIFAMAQRLNVKACAVVDAEASGIQPEWMERLLGPILGQGFDFAAPYYQRHKFDGTLTNGIVYPLNRALYGKRLRQSMGFEFGFSRPFIEYCAGQKNWATDAAATATDIWLCSRAAAEGFRICEANLGPQAERAKQHTAEVSSILTQVLGPLFSEIERNSVTWQKVKGSQAVPAFGPRLPVKAEPVPLDTTRLIEAFRKGSQDLRDIWGMVLSPATLIGLKKLAVGSDAAFVMKDDLWARSVYEFALGFRQRVIARDHLLQALTPLYLGWVASFLRQVEHATPAEFERRLEDLCLAYEAQKPYLISRWRWPDRFNP